MGTQIFGYRALATKWRNDHCPALRRFEQDGKIRSALLADVDYLIRRMDRTMKEPGVELGRACEAMRRLLAFRELLDPHGDRRGLRATRKRLAMNERIAAELKFGKLSLKQTGGTV